MDFMNGINSSTIIDVPRSLQKNVINRINKFHILFIYDSRERKNRLKPHAKNIVNGKEKRVPFFSERQEGEAFIISEHSYNENRKLFQRLRNSARDDVFHRIATGIAAYYLSEHAKVIQTSMTHHPKLKDLQLLDVSVGKIKSLLEHNTFLSEEAAWETFYNWFKNCLTYHVVSMMSNENGRETLEHMDRDALNKEFHQRLMQEIQMDSLLMFDFITLIEQYLHQWMVKIIPSLDDHTLSQAQLESFLEIRNDSLNKNTRTVALPLTLTNGHLSVMSNPIYQSVRETLSNASFQQLDGLSWPAAQVKKGTIEGTVQYIPFSQAQDTNEQNVQLTALDQVKTLTELDVDVFDTLCSFYLSNAKHHQDVVDIQLQDFLIIRGLQPKLSGNGRRGGYGPEQTGQILKALSKIQNIWVIFNQSLIYEHGKPKEKDLHGRTFIFLDEYGEPYDISKCHPNGTIQYKIGEAFAAFLKGSSKQIALLPLKTLQYHPRHKQWEKKLIRYFSWRWRVQARKENYNQPYKVNSLLEAIGQELNHRTPSRTRDRLEQALDALQQDGLIASWEYMEWEESTAENYGWARVWANTRLEVTPPATVKEQYQSITKNSERKNKSADQNQSAHQLGIQLKEFREKLGLTLADTASEIGLSAAYISIIERGKKIPSSYVANQIMDWIHRPFYSQQ